LGFIKFHDAWQSYGFWQNVLSEGHALLVECFVASFMQTQPRTYFAKRYQQGAHNYLDLWLRDT